VEGARLRRVRRPAEAVLGGPAAHLGAAALQDGDVKRVDAHLEQDLRARCGERAAEEYRRRRIGLADEPLEGPIAAALDRARDAGKRDERTELAAPPRELERGHVVLHSVVVAGEGGGAEQIDRAVRADEPGARRGGL